MDQLPVGFGIVISIEEHVQAIDKYRGPVLQGVGLFKDLNLSKQAFSKVEQVT